MGATVFANGKSIACKVSGGHVMSAAPDVCLSPPSPPAGPIPIPYPNSAKDDDTANGSKTVQIGGQEVMLKDQSTFKKSTGNEAATKSLGMGVVTHQIQGEASFLAWSMDVKFEGENVPRHLDMMGHNEACNPMQTTGMYTNTVSSSSSKPCDPQKCDKSMSDAEYDSLRRKTPSRAIRKLIRATHKECLCTNTPPPTLAADHIVPLKKITSMPGFACLTKDEQKKVANDKENFTALCRSCNSSKCAKDWTSWTGHIKREFQWTPWVAKQNQDKAAEQEKSLGATVTKMYCDSNA
jgi:5-methylcytosine-specific restriction endonuclease McrA